MQNKEGKITFIKEFSNQEFSNNVIFYRLVYKIINYSFTQFINFLIIC